MFYQILCFLVFLWITDINPCAIHSISYDFLAFCN